ncbi:MAG TPA: MBL fold metallo-hydrolase [Candidatus Binatia bacterium]|nr:MBL fold metallo-hydrolase [Candidatus Binatia bacterium]
MARPRVVFLGTGGALNIERYQASMLVQAGGTSVLLDVGGGLGVVRRLLACEVDPQSVRHVVLSHRHLDHVGGLEPLLMYMFYGAFSAGTPPPPVDVHALPGSSAAIRASLAAADASAGTVFGERLTWRTPKAGEPVTVDGGAALTLVPVDHLPPGGEAAGCVVSADGVRVVYSGDTRPCDALVEAARGADLLIHEAGGTEARAEFLHRVGHSTAADAGRIAARAGVRALAMFHTPAAMWVAPEDMLSEARRAAPGVEVFLAEDGMRWEP